MIVDGLGKDGSCVRRARSTGQERCIAESGEKEKGEGVRGELNIIRGLMKWMDGFACRKIIGDIDDGGNNMSPRLSSSCRFEVVAAQFQPKVSKYRGPKVPHNLLPFSFSLANTPRHISCM